MSRPEMLWASLVLIAAGGCIHDSFLNFATNKARYTRVVDGAPGLVSTMVEEGFSSAGVTVLLKRHEHEIRLAGQTKSGQVFCVYIRPDKASPSSKSTVTIKWDRQSDEQLWDSVLERLPPSASTENDSPKE